MAPVNADQLDWDMAVTEAVAVTDCAPCNAYAVLEAALAALAGAVSAEILKDLSSLVVAAREGRLVTQLKKLQGAYAEAVEPFHKMVGAYKTGSMSGVSFIIQFLFGLLGLAGGSPALLAHVPFLVVTAPFRWCATKLAEHAAARELADQQARREELVAVYSELQRQDAAAQGTRQVPDSMDTKDHLNLRLGDLAKGPGTSVKFDVKAPHRSSSWLSM